MAYELWDTDSGNMVGVYGTERAALEAVRGMPDVEHLALAREVGGRTRPIAEGAALGVRADVRRQATE